MDGSISEAGGHGLGVKPGYPRPRREQDSANDRAEMPPASCRKRVSLFASSNEGGKMDIAPAAEGGILILPWVACVAIYLAVARVNGALKEGKGLSGK